MRRLGEKRRPGCAPGIFSTRTGVVHLAAASTYCMRAVVTSAYCSHFCMRASDRTLADNVVAHRNGSYYEYGSS